MIFDSLQKEQLRDKVIALLGNVGMRVEHEKMRNDLLAMGCTLSPAGRVRMPGLVIDEFVRSQQNSQAEDDKKDKFLNNFGLIDWGHFLLWSGKQDVEEARMKKELRTSVFDCGPTKYYDYPSGEKLPVTTEIFVNMKKWAHTVPEIGYIANWYRQDVPPEIERIDSLVLALKITDKLGGIEAIYPEVIKYLQEIGEIVTGRPNESAYLAGSQCVTPPLTFDYRSAEEAVERKRRMVGRYHVATMMSIGLNTPVTVPSAVIMSAAEILGGMICVFSQDQDADITGRALASVVDMRNAQVTSAVPEAVVVNTSVKDLFNSYFGGHIRVDTFFTTAAKRPGFQAVAETFGGMTMNAKMQGISNFTYPGVGTLDNGAVGSPTQAVLDIEIKKANFIPETSSADDGMPFDELCAHVEGEKDFFTCEHTLDHFRNLQSSPIFRTDDISHGPWSGDETAVLNYCDEKWREQLKTYTPPNNLSDDKIKALDAVVARAKREFLKT